MDEYRVKKIDGNKNYEYKVQILHNGIHRIKDKFCKDIAEAVRYIQIDSLNKISDEKAGIIAELIDKNHSFLRSLPVHPSDYDYELNKGTDFIKEAAIFSDKILAKSGCDEWDNDRLVALMYSLKDMGYQL